MREREDDKGVDKSCVKIGGDSKKSNRWKSFMEMKEYLRSEFEKKVERRARNGGETYLHFSVYLGDVDATKVLIEDNAEVNALDEWKYTALHIAAWKGHAEVASVLIQNGADVNAVQCNKWTALHFAAESGHVDVVKVLIQNGADMNAVDKWKCTALHKAAAKGRVDVAKR